MQNEIMTSGQCRIGSVRRCSRYCADIRSNSSGMAAFAGGQGLRSLMLWHHGDSYPPHCFVHTGGPHAPASSAVMLGTRDRILPSGMQVQ